MRTRSPAIHAQQYLTLIARAYADRAGEPAPPAVRTNFVTLRKACVGVKVQAWFRRHTESKIPELRIGVCFDLSTPTENARRAETFAARFAAELKALDAEDWPSDTGTDRRWMTALPVADGCDVDRVTTAAAGLAGRYEQLLVQRRNPI